MADANQSNEIIATLKNVATAVTGSFDLDTLLQSIVEACNKFSNASRGALFLHDEDKHELIMRAEIGNAPSLRFRAKYSTSVKPNDKAIGLTSYIFFQDEPVVLNSPEDIIYHPAHKGKYDDEQYPDKRRCQSFAGIPLKDPVTKKPIGVLKIENITGREPTQTFSPHELEVFILIADIASSSIVKFQERDNKFNTSLKVLSKSLGGTSQLKEKLKKIVKSFKEIAHADAASIWLIRDDKKLYCEAGAGYFEGLDGTEEQACYDLSFNLEHAKKVGLTAWIARSGESINIKSYQELIAHPQHKGTYDNRNYPNPNENKCESFIGAPLQIGDQIIGVIKADNRIEEKDPPHPTYFTEEEAQIFSNLAMITAIIVKNDQESEKRREYEDKLLELYKIGKECSELDQADEIMWYMLIGLTHNAGLGFNRAILFNVLDEDLPTLEGYMSVGPLNSNEGEKIRDDLNSHRLIVNLEDCKLEFRKNKNTVPNSSLQEFIENYERIPLSRQCSIYHNLTNSEQPTFEIIDPCQCCPEFKQLLNEIDSVNTNKEIILFSLVDSENQQIFGICDNVYSEHQEYNIVVEGFKTFVQQITLALQYLALKKTEAETRENAWIEFSSDTAHRIGGDTNIMDVTLGEIEQNISEKSFHKVLENKRKLDLTLKNLRKTLQEYIQYSTTMNKDYISINLVIQQAIMNVSPECKNFIEVVQNFDTDIPKILGDLDRLLYAFEEILHNAIKEMTNGGRLEVESKFNSERKMIKIQITDTGPGIDPDIIDHIFNRGFKKRKHGTGTGLGLDIVKRYILGHRGNIFAQNIEGKGAQFCIKLPVISDTNKNRKYDRILVVEDVEELRNALCNKIKKELPAIHVDSAIREQDAIKLLKNHKYDFVITDVDLSDGGGSNTGGIRILEEIRRKSIDTKPIVLTTNFGQSYKNTPLLEKAKELGAVHCVDRLAIGATSSINDIIEYIS